MAHTLDTTVQCDMSTIVWLQRSRYGFVSTYRHFSSLPILNANYGSKFSETVRCLSTSDSSLEIERRLTEKSINPCIREMEYAVRGKVPLEAGILRKQLVSLLIWFHDCMTNVVCESWYARETTQTPILSEIFWKPTLEMPMQWARSLSHSSGNWLLLVLIRAC